jgi:hypothetical protein
MLMARETRTANLNVRPLQYREVTFGQSSERHQELSWRDWLIAGRTTASWLLRELTKRSYRSRCEIGPGQHPGEASDSGNTRIGGK